MSKNKNTKESMSCLTPKPSKTFHVYRMQSKEKFYREGKGGAEDWTKKEKNTF